MPERPSAAANSAVFLSYAREDTDVARRIAEALRTFGVEVWFDQDELRGGDAWDQRIKRQIRECTLFVALISTHTQARSEGYFRREWKLAIERSHDMAHTLTFVVPIAIDGTTEAEALVPEQFLSVHWTRLPNGRPTPQFVAAIQALLEKSAGDSVSTGANANRRMTGTRSRRGLGRLIVVALAFGLAAGAGWLVLKQRSAPPPASPPVIEPRSVAVLPFVNMSDDKSNAYFADGIHEDLLTSLANFSSLRVIARTSVDQYRESSKSIRQIGTELGVAYVLEGSVRRAGARVRVTAQLIDARTEGHVWAERYTREFDLNDVFTIQSELASEIATALHAALTPEEKNRLDSRPTQNLAAYDLFLQGRERLRAEDSNALRANLEQAESLLSQAVALDPTFALAWGELAAADFKVYTVIDHSPDRLNRAKACVDNAVRLAPDEPELMVINGNYWELIGDLKQAREIYEQVARVFPSNTDALIGLSWVDRKESRWADAVAAARQAIVLDPRSATTRGQLARLLFTLRRYDEMEADGKRGISDDPSTTTIDRFYIAEVPFVARGDTAPMDAVVASFSATARRADPDTIFVCAQWADTQGDAQELVRLWQESGPNWRINLVHPNAGLLPVAAAFLKLGQPERARPLLVQTLNLLTAELAAQPTNSSDWESLALTQAMLGDQTAARETLAKLQLLGDPHSAPRRAVLAEIYSWLGDKDSAVTALASLLREPDAPTTIRVNLLRHALLWWPLQDRAAFVALLNDPQNNAPFY